MADLMKQYSTLLNSILTNITQIENALENCDYVAPMEAIGHLTERIQDVTYIRGKIIQENQGLVEILEKVPKLKSKEQLEELKKTLTKEQYEIVRLEAKFNSHIAHYNVISNRIEQAKTTELSGLDRKLFEGTTAPSVVPGKTKHL